MREGLNGYFEKRSLYMLANACDVICEQTSRIIEFHPRIKGRARFLVAVQFCNKNGENTPFLKKLLKKCSGPSSPPRKSVARPFIRAGVYNKYQEMPKRYNYSKC